MTDIFIELLKMSITASIFAVAVILFRIVFKKAPRYIICILLALVAVRLICPFSIKTELSVIPDALTSDNSDIFYVSEQLQTENAVSSEQVVLDQNPVIPSTIKSTSSVIDLMYVFSIVWLFGIASLLVYAYIIYFRIKRKIRISIPYSRNIFFSDGISSPFIFGVFKPKIYIPSDMSHDELDCVLSHEMAHIKRFDHIWTGKRISAHA